MFLGFKWKNFKAVLSGVLIFFLKNCLFQLLACINYLQCARASNIKNTVELHMYLPQPGTLHNFSLCLGTIIFLAAFFSHGLEKCFCLLMIMHYGNIQKLAQVYYTVK